MKEGSTIYTVLTGDGDVSALVGTRIYPEGKVPQNPTAPYVEYSRIAGTPTHTLTDFGNTENVQVQIDCYSDDYSEVEDLAQKVRAALFAGMNVGRFTDLGFYEPEVELHRVSIDASIWL
jgi:hypothetical protein